jgi:hypothetical protein
MEKCSLKGCLGTDKSKILALTLLPIIANVDVIWQKFREITEYKMLLLTNTSKIPSTNDIKHWMMIINDA